MWPFRGKADGLAEYILMQIKDSPHSWKFNDVEDPSAVMHGPSGIRLWFYRGFTHIDIYESGSRQGVGFTMAQKWKIHRRLKKLLQKARKEINKPNPAEVYLGRMIAGTLNGNPVKE